ncbi:hypothetical protein HFP70_35095 [Streptomyces sp. ARC14]
MGTPKDPGKAKKKGKNDGPTSVEELSDSPFPAYQELKELLISQGVPAEKIRFIHEAKNDAEKARLFADARNGKIAVLVGSTTKMGTGTNVQLRATALHHLDCPWRPADLEQRNGRIIRQGNFNPEVAIFQYVTEQSFDGFSWQTVARKAKFIRQLMKGNLTDRTVEDIPDGVFNAEQVTAISTGNPYLLEQANVKASLAVLKRKLKGHERTVEGYKTTIHAAERLRQDTDKLVAQLRDVIARRKNTRGDAFNATIGNSDFTKRDEAAKALSTAAQAVLRQGQKDPYKSGGHPRSSSAASGTSRSPPVPHRMGRLRPHPPGGHLLPGHPAQPPLLPGGRPQEGQHPPGHSPGGLAGRRGQGHRPLRKPPSPGGTSGRHRAGACGPPLRAGQGTGGSRAALQARGRADPRAGQADHQRGGRPREAGPAGELGAPAPGSPDRCRRGFRRRGRPRRRAGHRPASPYTCAAVHLDGREGTAAGSVAGRRGEEGRQGAQEAGQGPACPRGTRREHPRS